VYVLPDQDARSIVAEYEGMEMYGIHEIYRLDLDKAVQLAERRAFHLD
jgi:hypothetical protein